MTARDAATRFIAARPAERRVSGDVAARTASRSDRPSPDRTRPLTIALPSLVEALGDDLSLDVGVRRREPGALARRRDRDVHAVLRVVLAAHKASRLPVEAPSGRDAVLA